MKTIDYDNLDKHFTAPKIISPFYNYKRLPRKRKKEIKKWFEHNGHIFKKDYLTINQQLWFMLEYTNYNYKRYLIKKLL